MSESSDRKPQYTISEKVRYQDFNPETSDFGTWVQAMEIYCRIKGIKDDSIRIDLLVQHLPSGDRDEGLIRASEQIGDGEGIP